MAALSSVRNVRHAVVAAAVTVVTGCSALPPSTDLLPIEEFERQSVIRELSRQRDAQGVAKAGEIDAQIEKVKRATPSPRSASRGDGEIHPRIVNGVMTASYPAVGAVLYRMAGADGVFRFTTWCTGTLIGSKTFITAAHCIAKDGTTDNYRLFFQHAGVFNVERIAYQDALYRFPKADVAILHLKTAVNGIRVQPITSVAASRPGLSAVIVGFGRTGGQNEVYGIKRTGFVKTATCSCAIPATCSTAGELICWAFNAQIANPGMDSNTCNADSGGPLLFEHLQGEALSVIGTTSGGTRSDCLSRDESYDAAVFKYRAWIVQEAGADLGVTAQGSSVGDDGVSVLATAGKLDASARRMSYPLRIAAGAARAVVSLNGDDIPSGANQFDLEVSPPPGSNAPAGCGGTQNTQFKSCELVNPLAGEWRITVTARRGSGDFQLVATAFAR
jgi:hypothetical protein